MVYTRLLHCFWLGSHQLSGQTEVSATGDSSLDRDVGFPNRHLTNCWGTRALLKKLCKDHR